MLIALFVFKTQAQNSDTIITSIKQYSEMELPPLNILLENAQNTPSIEYYDYLIEQEQSQMKSDKRDWLKYLKVDGIYRYGINATQPSADEGGSLILSNSPQSWYNIGATVSIPLDDVFDRGEKSKRQKLKIESINQQKATTYELLKLDIIEIYTAAEKELMTLKLKVEEVALVDIQYRESENEFINGKITAKELSAQKSLQSATIQSYMDSKFKLRNALLKLEILTHTQIINK